jgi:hypothetical protein
VFACNRKTVCGSSRLLLRYTCNCLAGQNEPNLVQRLALISRGVLHLKLGGVVQDPLEPVIRFSFEPRSRQSASPAAVALRILPPK